MKVDKKRLRQAWAAGMNDREIATLFGVRKPTVRYHRSPGAGRKPRTTSFTTSGPATCTPGHLQ
jgi:hypothetical protein